MPCLGQAKLAVLGPGQRATGRLAIYNGDACSHGRMGEERKAASWLGTAPPAQRCSGDPDVVTAVEAGDGAEDRGRSGRGSDLERRRRKRNQAEPIFSAHKRGGSKGGRSCAAAEDGRGGSISSDEAHRQRQLLLTVSSACSKKAGVRPP